MLRSAVDRLVTGGLVVDADVRRIRFEARFENSKTCVEALGDVAEGETFRISTITLRFFLTCAGNKRGPLRGPQAACP